MPQMGYDMHEGTVVRWLKAEGDEVQVGEPIAEIETDKAVVEFESTAAGVLSKVLVQEGTSVPVGDPIGIIGAAGEETPEPAEADGRARWPRRQTLPWRKLLRLQPSPLSLHPHRSRRRPRRQSWTPERSARLPWRAASPRNGE